MLHLLLLKAVLPPMASVEVKLGLALPVVLRALLVLTKMTITPSAYSTQLLMMGVPRFMVNVEEKVGLEPLVARRALTALIKMITTINAYPVMLLAPLHLHPHPHLVHRLLSLPLLAVPHFMVNAEERIGLDPIVVLRALPAFIKTITTINAYPALQALHLPHLLHPHPLLVRHLLHLHLLQSLLLQPVLLFMVSVEEKIGRELLVALRVLTAPTKMITTINVYLVLEQLLPSLRL